MLFVGNGDRPMVARIERALSLVAPSLHAPERLVVVFADSTGIVHNVGRACAHYPDRRVLAVLPDPDGALTVDVMTAGAWLCIDVRRTVEDLAALIASALESVS